MASSSVIMQCMTEREREGGKDDFAVKRDLLHISVEVFEMIVLFISISTLGLV